MTVVEALTPRPGNRASSTPAWNGAVKVRRPVASVSTCSPPVNATTAPGAKRPSASSTASVAFCPATSFAGKTIVAPGAFSGGFGGFCATVELARAGLRLGRRLRGGGSFSAWRRVFHVFVKPGDHFPEDVFDGLARRVAVGFVREGDVAHRAAGALDRVVHPLGLNRECAGVVVRFAVDEQDGRLDLVRVQKRRNLHVDLRRFPQRPPLALQAEWGQRAVVGAAAGDARAE